MMLTRHTPRATLAATCVSDGTALAHALQDEALLAHIPSYPLMGAHHE